jgi:hypothetical protein
LERPTAREYRSPGGEWPPALLREQSTRLVLDKPMILFLELRLRRQLLFPGVFQRSSHEPMLRLDHLVLTSRPFDFVGGSFAPRLSEPIQLGTLLLHTLCGGKR